MEETLHQLADGTAPRTPQDELLVSYVPKLTRDDGRLNWNQPAINLERRIRAYDPWPGTFTIANEAGKEKRLKIFPHCHVMKMQLPPGTIAEEGGRLIIGCGEDALAVTTVQPEGGRRMSSLEYLRGRKPQHFF